MKEEQRYGVQAKAQNKWRETLKRSEQIGKRIFIIILIVFKSFFK